MIYEEFVNHRGQQSTRFIFFFIFLLTVQRIRMFFSLKPSVSQGKSSLKISAHQIQSFRRSQGTNKETDRLTDILLLQMIDKEQFSFNYDISIHHDQAICKTATGTIFSNYRVQGSIFSAPCPHLRSKNWQNTCPKTHIFQAVTF